MAAYPNGFALFAGDTDGVVYASEDDAETWTRIAGGLAPVTKGNHYRALSRPDHAYRSRPRLVPRAVDVRLGRALAHGP